MDWHHYQSLHQLLSPDESERAGRFRFECHRMQYVIGRGLLRVLLAGYLQTQPGAIRFHYTSKGKPELAGETGGIQFNLAHSGRIILLGFSRDRRIGIDLEEIRKDIDIDEIAERFFSPVERHYLASLPIARRYGEFFRCWTRKEALLKGTGEGLSVTLDSFSVLPSDDENSCSLRTETDREWLIQDLDLGLTYVGAAAIEH